MRATTISLAILMMLSAGTKGRGQESTDVEELQKQVAELKGALEHAHLEIDALNEKLDELSKTSGKTAGKKKGASLSDRMSEGAELEGDYRSAAVAGIGRIRMKITKREGMKATGTTSLSVEGKDLGETRWEGTIRGNRFSFTRVGSGNKVASVLEMKGDALEGVFVDSQGNRGSVGLRLPLPAVD